MNAGWNFSMNTTPEDLIKKVEQDYPETCAEYKRIQHEMYTLFCKKQSDYGPNNISLGSDLKTEPDIRAALSGVIFRCNDKVQRLLNLVVKKGTIATSNEPIDDAFADLGNYAIIMSIVKRGKWCK